MTRHSTDPLSLFFGLVFAGAGAIVLADRVDLADRLRWAWPIVLIALALAMFASAATARRVSRPAVDRPPQPPGAPRDTL